MPIARVRCKKTGPYEVSRSRMRYRGASSFALDLKSEAKTPRIQLEQIGHQKGAYPSVPWVYVELNLRYTQVSCLVCNLVCKFLHQPMSAYRQRDELCKRHCVRF